MYIRKPLHTSDLLHESVLNYIIVFVYVVLMVTFEKLLPYMQVEKFPLFYGWVHGIRENTRYSRWSPYSKPFGNMVESLTKL